jgi:DUF1680 family protein
MIWGNIDNTFTVLMYESGEVKDSIKADDGSPISLHIKCVTRYPEEGKVEYAVTPSSSATFTLRFRVPGWSSNFAVTAGGKTYTNVSGAFAEVKKRWKAGDKVIVTFDMPLQIIPGGISYPDKIAFKRGPQVLAVDQSLNSADSIGQIAYDDRNHVVAVAKNAVPAAWEWKQAYSLTLQYNNKPKSIVLVPFAEAGQSGSNVAVWINSANNFSKN